MKPEILLGLAVFVPIIGAFVLPLMNKISSTARNSLAFALVAVSFICSLLLIPAISDGSRIFYSVFNIDILAVFMALVSSSIGLIIVLYSFDYISHYPNQNEYYVMVVLFLGSMMGLVYAQNLIFIYVFWEMTAIASWRLIGFYREKKDVLKADKAFMVTMFGSLAMLVGFLAIFGQSGTFELRYLTGYSLSSLVVILLLMGIFAKSATFPFQTWLPDAGVAPSPVTALLHAAVLVKIGVYIFARFFVFTFNMEAIWQTIIPAVAAVSALVSAGAALRETDIKRIIAYSTVSQIAFIFLGLASGNPIGIMGGLLYILMHGIAKGGLFLAAGMIEQSARTKDITKMGGLIKAMPITALSFLLCAFSVMGIPPFGGFFSKFMVMAGGIASGHYIITLVFIVGAFLTIIYLFRLFNLVFLGEPQGLFAREGSRLMIYCVAWLAFLSLASGLLVNYPLGFLNTIVEQVSWLPQ